MTEHSTLYEDMGYLKGAVEAIQENQRFQLEQMKELVKKVDANVIATAGLKVRVAAISAGIGSVVTAVFAFFWDYLIGKT